MRILVTGGAGFVGSNLCARLVKDPENYVIALDNLFTGSMDNIAPLMKLPNFEFVRHDVMDPIDIPVDQIYNAACPASPPAYQADPVNTMKINVFGMLNMLDLANKYHARVLQFSTSEVYGDALVHPQKETYWGNVNPDGIRSCYDEGKRAAETLCFDYNRMYGTKIKVIRIFNTYGPNMNPEDGRVISNFVNQAIAGEDITIYGHGEQTRSFCYVDDLVEGIIRMMNSEESFLGPVNLGNPGEFTMKELAELVLEKTGSKSELVYRPLPKDDPQQRRPDITLAKQKLDWAPTIPLSEGLERVIAYYRALREKRMSLV